MTDLVYRRAARGVLASGFVGSVISVGLTFYLFGVFQDAMVADLGTDVATFSWAPTLFAAMSGLLSPVVGRSLATRDRPGLSIRRVMLAGACAIGLGLVALSRTPSLAVAAAVFGLLVAPGAILLGPLLAQSMITNWYAARRGWALGIVSAGTTVGGMLMPPVAATLIGTLGWRNALASLGGLALAVAIPIVLLLVRDRPEELGLTIDGAAPERTSEEAGGDPDPTRDTATLLRDPQLWLVGLTFGLLYSAGTVSTVFMVPYATELGLPLLGGAAIASMRAGSGALGKIVLGSLSDRLGVRPVLYGVVAIEVALTLVLIQTTDPLLFTALGVAIGFVGGSPVPLKAALVGRLFGRSSFAASMGLAQTVGVPFQLFMVPIGGAIYQGTGTYAAVFGLTIPCFLGAGLLLAFVRASSARVETA